MVYWGGPACSNQPLEKRNSGDGPSGAARPDAGVWATLGLMSVSALCGAITDLNFNGTGYAWQLLNCLLTAAYALTLRGIMDKVLCPAVRLTRWTMHLLSCAVTCSMQRIRYEKYRHRQVALMHTPAHAFSTQKPKRTTCGAAGGAYDTQSAEAGRVQHGAVQ